MFGIPLTTLISLAVRYGPQAVSFVQAVDPILHQLVVAATPLAKHIAENLGASFEDAAKHGAAALAQGGAAWTREELEGWWARASGDPNGG